MVRDSLFRSLASGWAVTYAEVIDLYVIDTALAERHSLIYKSLLSISLCILLSPSPQPLGSSKVGASPSVLLSDCTFLSVPKGLY